MSNPPNQPDPNQPQYPQSYPPQYPPQYPAQAGYGSYPQYAQAGAQYGYPPAYGTKPGVVTWFTVYAILMALLYLLVGGLGLFFVLAPNSLLEAQQSTDEIRIQGIVMTVISVPLMVAFGIAPMLPRRPGVWIYNIVLICLGMTSCCTMAAAIPMLIYWLKPETKVWFGRNP